MAAVLPVLMLVILFVCMATLMTEGMWSNALRLINVVTAALLATNYFEPLANWLDGLMPAATYIWDFVSLWMLFAGIMFILRTLTDLLSRVKVRFLSIADRIGSAFFSFWISWVLICFTLMTLHTAPLSRNFLFGSFSPEERMMLVAPDRQWLGFMQKVSLGVFCRSATAAEREKQLNVFDASADFMPKYATRRAAVEELVKKNNSVLVRQRRSGLPPPE